MVNSEFNSAEGEQKNPNKYEINRNINIESILDFLNIQNSEKQKIISLLIRLGINTGEEIFMTRRSLDSLVDPKQINSLISEGILVPDELWSKVGIETERTPYTLDIDVIYDLEKAAELENESEYI